MNNTFENNERKNELHKISDLMSDTLNEIETAIKSKGCIGGIKTGFNDLDTIICGLQRKEVVVVASRPGMGKTSLALNLAYNMCKNDYSVAYFSLESSRIQVVKRILSLASGVSAKLIDVGTIPDENLNDIVNMAIELNDKKLFISNSPKITTKDITDKCKKLKETNGLDAIIIDYIQLMYYENDLENNCHSCQLSREEEMEIIVRDLKTLAKDLNVPIIILSQLSRMAEINDKPELSDSDVIGKHSDLVLLITANHKDNCDYNIADIIVAKNRRGKTGTIKLRFDRQTGCFNEFDEMNDN